MLRTYGAVMPWRRNLQNEVYDHLLKFAVGVVSIRGEHPLAVREENEPDPLLTARCPALRVPSSEWRNVADDLIARAACIICEVWSDTPGVSEELLMLRRLRRADDALILLPRPGTETMRNYDTFEGFWRVALYRDLDRYDLFAHPCARALGNGAIDQVTTPYWSGTGIPPRESAVERGGIPIVIPDLVDLAERYVREDGDWGAAAVHAQNAWNIGVRLAAKQSWMTLVEWEGLIRAAILLAYRLLQFNRLKDALDKLDVALVIASDFEELMHYKTELERIRQQHVRLTGVFPG